MGCGASSSTKPAAGDPSPVVHPSAPRAKTEPCEEELTSAALAATVVKKSMLSKESTSLHIKNKDDLEQAKEAQEVLSESGVGGFVGLLTLNALRARLGELKFKSKHDDAYLIISFGTTTFRTGVVRDSRDPEWDETCVIPITAAASSQTQLTVRFSLYDDEILSKDKFLGRCDFLLTDLTGDAVLPEYVPLLRENGDTTGALLHVEGTYQTVAQVHLANPNPCPHPHPHALPWSPTPSPTPSPHPTYQHM